ncbi:hypothetical protein [Mucilaginibacter sp. L196]|uniref:hypothetical protein n=1 Tax=Mucilaginibacter sp. L196 TaxID=1641870 RepID=UPI00131CFFD2|nr:hypothetical protein [Mucilaginibacter sp. L196]
MNPVTMNLDVIQDLNFTIKKNALYFTIGVVLFSIGNVVFFTISPIIAQLIQTVACVLFLQKLFVMADWKFESSYLKILFFALIAWSSFVIFKGLDLSFPSVKKYIYSDFVFWPFIVPFTALLPKNGVVFKQMFLVFFYLAIVFLVFAIFAAKLYFVEPSIGEQGVWAFSSGGGFILLTWKYHSNFRRLVALGAIVTALIVVTLLARRNLILTNINFLIFSFLLYLGYYTKGNIQKKLSSLFFFLVMISLAVVVFQQRKGTDFKLITGRASEDTRQGVLTYYFSGIKGYELMGKGMDGTYICPVFNQVTKENQLVERDVIECGYLQIILSGGLIQLFLFLLITVPAVILGVFYSRNGLSKACGIIILLWLIDMIPYGLPTISVRYMLVWFAVGVCYSKSFRRLTESEILIQKVI